MLLDGFSCGRGRLYLGEPNGIDTPRHLRTLAQRSLSCDGLAKRVRTNLREGLIEHRSQAIDSRRGLNVETSSHKLISKHSTNLELFRIEAIAGILGQLREENEL